MCWQGVFAPGDTIALRPRGRHCLPHHLYRQRFFKLTVLQLPPHCHLVAKGGEPLWAAIQPCDEGGVVAAGATTIKIGCSWIDPDFCVDFDASDTEREINFTVYAADKVDPSLSSHRIKVIFRGVYISFIKMFYICFS